MLPRLLPWLLVPALCLAQGAPEPRGRSGAHAIESEELEWRPVEGLPKGAEYAVLRVEPESKAAELLVRLPRHYEVPDHAHTHAETLVVLQGALTITLDGHEREYGPGSYVRTPAGQKHSVRSSRWRSLLFYARVEGPFDLLFDRP